MKSFHDSLFANEELIAKRGARQGLSTNFWTFLDFFYLMKMEVESRVDFNQVIFLEFLQGNCDSAQFRTDKRPDQPFRRH
jgi:hypothetical protein